MGFVRAMDEHKGVPGWLIIASIALISLLALAALYAPRFRHPRVAPKVAPATHPIMPTVSLWLSTQDRRLRLAQQPDIEMGPRESVPADVVIDIDRKYQSIVGFGAALTDSSAWLLQDKLNERQRSALLLEMFGPPPNLNLNMSA
jgi:O-Glycosyl hydrolase family 30.